MTCKGTTIKLTQTSALLPSSTLLPRSNHYMVAKIIIIIIITSDQ